MSNEQTTQDKITDAATEAYRAISDARDKVAALGGLLSQTEDEFYWRHTIETYDMLTTAMLRVDG